MSKEVNEAVGICLEMCPQEERILRQHERLLHSLEMTDELDSRGRRYKADPAKAVKCFSRPAAGTLSPGPDKLRPAPVLVSTVHYLLKLLDVLPNQINIDLYDFVSDRLRAVRQDMTIQRLGPEICIKLIVPMIRFHALFGYILHGNKKFEFHLNSVHLQECILKVFECYSLLSETFMCDRGLVESIYTCLNINNPEIILPRIKNWNGNNVNLLKAAITKNYARFFQVSVDLDLFSKAVLAMHIAEIRIRLGLFSFCHAFSSPNAMYPIHRLQKIFSYNSIDDVMKDCNKLGIRCSDGFCKFSKKDLIEVPSHVPVSRWWCIDDDLQTIDLPKLLLASDW